jgi:hypothetical protein
VAKSEICPGWHVWSQPRLFRQTSITIFPSSQKSIAQSGGIEFLELRQASATRRNRLDVSISPGFLVRPRIGPVRIITPCLPEPVIDYFTVGCTLHPSTLDPWTQRSPLGTRRRGGIVVSTCRWERWSARLKILLKPFGAYDSGYGDQP